jgi:hypothetical protein
MLENQNDKMQYDINKIRKDINMLSENIFILQNNLKHSGVVFNNKVFLEHKDKSINRLTRILNYAQKIVTFLNKKEINSEKPN